MSFTTLGCRAARLARTPVVSRRAGPSFTAGLRNYSSPSNPTQFSAPSNPALNTDEAKNRPGYEEYREEVEPKYANVDQTFVFEDPKVCPSFVFHSLIIFGDLRSLHFQQLYPYNQTPSPCCLLSLEMSFALVVERPLRPSPPDPRAPDLHPHTSQ